MAESGSILDSLWNWVLPRSAEATVVGGPDEEAMLAEAARRNAQQQGQYLPDMQQRIVNAAQQAPGLVRVQQAPGLMNDPRAGYPVADFDPRTSVVRYDPGVPGRDRPNTIAHELLHFLNQQTAQVPEATQHALMQKVLGAQGYTPGGVMPGYQPGAFSPVEHSIINEWLGGPRDWPR